MSSLKLIQYCQVSADAKHACVQYSIPLHTAMVHSGMQHPHAVAYSYTTSLHAAHIDELMQHQNIDACSHMKLLHAATKYDHVQCGSMQQHSMTDHNKKIVISAETKAEEGRAAQSPTGQQGFKQGSS